MAFYFEDTPPPPSAQPYGNPDDLWEVQGGGGFVNGVEQPSFRSDSGQRAPLGGQDAARLRGMTPEQIEATYGDVRRADNAKRMAAGLPQDPNPYSGPVVYNYDVGNPWRGRRGMESERDAAQFGAGAPQGQPYWEHQQRLELAQKMRSAKFTHSDELMLNRLNQGRSVIEKEWNAGTLNDQDANFLLNRVLAGASDLQARKELRLKQEEEAQEAQWLRVQRGNRQAGNELDRATLNQLEGITRRVYHPNGGYTTYGVDKTGKPTVLDTSPAQEQVNLAKEDMELRKQAKHEVEVQTMEKGNKPTEADQKAIAARYTALKREADKRRRDEQFRQMGIDPNTLPTRQGDQPAVPPTANGQAGFVVPEGSAERTAAIKAREEELARRKKATPQWPSRQFPYK